MLRLAAGLAEHGKPIDLVVCRADNSYLDKLPTSVNFVKLQLCASWRGRIAVRGADPYGFLDISRPVLFPLKGAWGLRYIPNLVAYLKRMRW